MVDYLFFNDKSVVITGGAGFIGSALTRRLLAFSNCRVLILDKLGHGSNLKALESCSKHRYNLVNLDLADVDSVKQVCLDFKPTIFIHLAAESHVDRSIENPFCFVESNIVGTYSILEAAIAVFNSLSEDKQESFRFHHVSTDEVFGSLGSEGCFKETTPYSPNSPYSASKAASDHLVHAWGVTYGLPVTTTNCSNNFGPWQADEKFIPTVIRSLLTGQAVPIYGCGANVRDWLYVEDHVDALLMAVRHGQRNSKYCIGGGTELSNLELCYAIDETLENLGCDYLFEYRFVEDRKGHDFRYAIDSTKALKELGWKPKTSFANALKCTVEWYVDKYI